MKKNKFQKQTKTNNSFDPVMYNEYVKNNITQLEILNSINNNKITNCMNLLNIGYSKYNDPEFLDMMNKMHNPNCPYSFEEILIKLGNINKKYPDKTFLQNEINEKIEKEIENMSCEKDDQDLIIDEASLAFNFPNKN